MEHITSDHNKIHTDEQTHITAGQNINLNHNQIQAGAVIVRSEQGQLNITDSQMESKHSLYLQGKTQNSANNTLIAQDNISIHSQESNHINNTAIQAGKHLVMSSKNADIQINNQDKAIKGNGLISIRAEQDIALNQSIIQGGAIALHSKSAGIDWQNAQIKIIKHDVLGKDEQLKAANGSLAIKSHHDMTILAGKTLESAGDIELHSQGDLILQGEGGQHGRGSEKKISLISKGHVYLKGKNTELQGTSIQANGAIKAYAVDGDLTVTAIKNDIQPIKDEQRIQEISAEISQIDTQINTLKQDQLYQNAFKQKAETQRQLEQLEQDFKALATPNEQEKKTFNAQKQAFNKTIDRLQKEIQDRKNALGITKDLAQLEQDKTIATKRLKIAQTPFDGSEHTGSQLTAQENIELVAKNGIRLEQANLTTPEYSIIQALGTGKEREISKDDQGQPIKMPFAISIEGLHDIYQRGQEHDEAFSLHNNYQPTSIKADKGILIQAIGTGEIQPNQSTAASSPYNILMVGGDYQAKNGTITVQSLGTTLLQAGQDSIYDRETQTFKKKSWGGAKKKLTIVTTTEQIQDADVVKLTAQNIQIQAGDHIIAYGTAFNAQDNKQNGNQTSLTNKNNVLLQAGDSVRLLAVQEVNDKKVDVQKISSFAGIKYKKSKTSDSYQVLSELPTKVVADITQSQSGANTELQGTQFHTLEKANIVAGVGVKAIPDAKIILSTISTTISEEQTREYNNLVWQSIAGKGSITETAQLPSFTGVEPTFNATGGITVQVPINKNDPNQKEHLVAVLQRLSQEPGFAYLDELIKRDDIDYIAVKLAQEQWDYKQEGLTAAAAALIAIALTIATGGAAAGISAAVAGATTSSVVGAMAGAAFSSLVSQAGVTLINNKGDVSKTLKDLGQSSTVKQIAQAAVTAGITQGLDNFLNKANEATQTANHANYATKTEQFKALVNEKLVRNIIAGTGGALTEHLLYGTDLEDALKSNLTAQLVDNVSSAFYSTGVKSLDKDTLIANISHKLAAGLTGCVAAKAKDKSCEAGAVGAVIGEMVGDWMVNDHEVEINGRKYLTLEKGSKEYNRIVNTARLAAGSVALLYDFNVDTAAESAKQAVVNNGVNAAQIGTIEEFINLLNTSKRKVGLYKNDKAHEYLLSLQKTDWKYEPIETGFFNNKQARYIYTEKGGWIDMVHFLFYASIAYAKKQEIAYIPTMTEQQKNKASIEAAVLYGMKQEKMYDRFFAKHSYLSYEDLPSDYFGAKFAIEYFNPKSELTFSQQIQSFLKNNLKATQPEIAPNYNQLPKKDDGKHSGIYNKTINPMFTK